MEVVRQKNAATYVVFPIVDADGDTVTGAASLDSELDAWSDGAAPDGFADCTNEATEIGSTGYYYLSLTQTEMNNDYIVVQVKTGTAGAKTQCILIRTHVGDPLNYAVTDDGTAINVASGIVEAQVKSIDNNAITAAAIATGAIDADAIADNAIDAGAIAADAITAAKIADGAIDAATFAAGAITASAIAADAIGASELAADAVAEIADAVWDEDATGHQTGGTFGQAIGDPGADTNTIFKAVVTDATGATVGVDGAAILVDTNELQTDWVNGGRLDLLVDAILEDTGTTLPATLDTIDNFLDTEITAILEDTSTTLDDAVDDLEGRLTAALATQLQAHSLGVGRGVVDAGSTTTAVVIKTMNGGAGSGTDDFYNGRHIVFTSGALLLQATSVSDYTGASKTLTVPALTGAPAEDVTFILV